MRLRRLHLLLALIAPLVCGSGGDPGVLLQIDRQAFVLSSRDLRDGVEGPSLRVALGSPEHQTPDGSFPLYQLVRDPAWEPGAEARAAGARPLPPSPNGPLGVAKLSFGDGGYAVHGGGHPLLLGKPVSLGCVRTADSDLLRLIDWLEAHDVLGPQVEQPDGERHQSFLRRARLVIR